ncbi:MAG TPA: PIN domain-containing protein, partial [Vicinamibacteria bacterium]
MLKVLLDTNQLVSSLLSTRGRQAQLLDAWKQRKFILVLAPKQMDEISDVLLRPKIAKKYPISGSDREAFLEVAPHGSTGTTDCRGAGGSAPIPTTTLSP